MKYHIFPVLLALLAFGCYSKPKSFQYKTVAIETVFEDSVSIRAIEFLDANTLAFAGSDGLYGSVDLNTGTVRTNHIQYDSIIPEFRAVAHTSSDFFMLSVASPALLYKTGENGKMELVYKETGEGVFYDAMKFWNDKEGIAVGDTMNGCLSIIITRDGGATWKKLNCSRLPSPEGNEGAFAASNSNIEIIGEQTWIATSAGRVYFSADKGQQWQATQTPIINDKETQGIYSIDFYGKKNGFAIGGDFTDPEAKTANKMLTTNGGANWMLVADGDLPGYKSCVQYVPNAGAEDLVAVGFTGITYSADRGVTWTELSKEGFYTIRFLNDKVAYAAGRGRISKLTFE